MSEHPAEDRQDNGLRASAYVPLTDVEPAIGAALLIALGRARIAAYLVSSGPHAPSDDRRRLFVASEERIDARTIVAAAVRALGEPEPDLPLPDDPLAGVDTDSAFNALIADWHVDTHSAIRQAERDLRREDENWQARLNAPPVEDPIWLDDDHYVPPPPPPLPRLALPTIIAMAILVLSIVLLATDGEFGVAGNFTFVVGIGGLLLGAGILLSRVREYRQDDDDDGAAI
ncbi:MAG: hypothetical protein ABI345_15865 [Jatrophihabitans sp.]